MGQKDFKYNIQGSTWSKNSYYASCGDFEIAVIDQGNLDDSIFEISDKGKILLKTGVIFPTASYQFKVSVKMAESDTIVEQDVEFQTFNGECDSSKWDLSVPSNVYETPDNQNIVIVDNQPASIMHFELKSHYKRECNQYFVNELTQPADSVLSITSNQNKVFVKHDLLVQQITEQTLTLSFRFKSESGVPADDHVLISQTITVKIDMSCNFNNDSLDFGEIITGKNDHTTITQIDLADQMIHFEWEPESDAFKNCLTQVQLTSQKKYTNAKDKVTVDQWRMQNTSLFVRQIKLQSFSTDIDQEPVPGVYELTFTASIFYPPQNAVYTLKIIHKDECYSLPEKLDHDLSNPRMRLRTFDVPLYLEPYNGHDFSSCNAFEMSATTPSLTMGDSSIIHLDPITELFFKEYPTKTILWIKFEPIPSYRADGIYKPQGEYNFGIIFKYAGKETQIDHIAVMKTRCDTNYLSMELSDECLANISQVNILYNIRHEFEIPSGVCEMTYKPQDCFLDDAERVVTVDFNTQYDGMFGQVDGSANETPLDTAGEYVVGNKFSVTIQVADPALEITKQIDFKLFYKFESVNPQTKIVLPIEVKPCPCNKWKLNDLPAEELIFLTGKDLTFVDPVCIDIAECQKGPKEWQIEFQDMTSAAALASPSSLSPDFFTTELPSTLKMKQIPIATVDTAVKVNVAYKYMTDTGEDVDRSQAEQLDVMFKPCWCSDYAIPEVTGVTHTFQEPTIELNVQEPSCTGDAANCLVATQFRYEALQADGSALPDGMTFDAATMIFSVNQLTNPADAKTIDVIIIVNTDETTITTPIEVKFQVKLEAAPDVSILAEPSLAVTYEMSFKDTFKQLFTFKSPADDALNIKARSHPFIEAEVGTADVLISVDGPAALNFTQASADKTESMKFEVNEQMFKFTIKLLYPPSEDKNETQSENQEDVSSKFADLLMTQKPNPIAKFYNFVPKTAEELAAVKITAAVQQIAKNGAISIAYEPPVATVPKEWSKYFNQAELNKLSPKEREIRKEKAKQFMHITFVQNSEEKEQAHFVANLTQFTPEGIQIRLNFSDPLFVSQGDQADQVRIKLLKEFFLNPGQERLLRDLSSVSAYDDGEYIVFTEDLPLLMASQEEFEKLQDQVSSAKDAMSAQFASSMFLQIFLSGALSMLWNIFNTLQIILALNLLMVAFPANIKMFQEQIQDLINLEIFPTDKIYDSLLVPMLDLQTSEEKKLAAMQKAKEDAENGIQPASRGLSEKFLGSSILMNVLTVVLALTLFVLVVAFVFVCKYTVLPRCCGCFKNVMVKLERKLFWNSLLRAFLEMYLSTSIFFFHAMGSIDTNDQAGRIEYLTWLATGCFLFMFPYVTFRILFARWTTIHKPEVRERYDSLYQNVDVYKGPIAFSFSFYFCLRRLAFAFVIGQVYRTIVFQIYLADLSSTLMLMYFICFLPMEDRINNAIQIFNEVVVLVCIQSMFLFTNYVESPEARHVMGQKVLYLVALNVFTNLTILIVIIGRKIYRAIRSWYFKRQLAKGIRLKVTAAIVKSSKKAFKERLGKVSLFKNLAYPDSGSSHMKQNDKKSGPPKRKPISDFIDDVKAHSDQISESESLESQSVSYESDEFSNDLSWHSAYSDESSYEDCEEEEDKEFPSRAQIHAFSDYNFKSQAHLIQMQYQDKENEMIARENPEVVLQFLTYQKFKVLGFKFCTLRRKAAIQTLKVAEEKKKALVVKRPRLIQAQQAPMVVRKDNSRQNSMKQQISTVNINNRRKKIIDKYHEQYNMSSDAGSVKATLPSIDHLSKELESIIGSQVLEIQAEQQVEVVGQKQQEAEYEEAKVHRVSLQAKRKSRYLRNLLEENEEDKEDCD